MLYRNSSTYYWTLLILVLFRELTEDFLLWEVNFVHTLVVGIMHTLLEPDIELAQVPYRHAESVCVQSHN